MGNAYLHKLACDTKNMLSHRNVRTMTSFSFSQPKLFWQHFKTQSVCAVFISVFSLLCMHCMHNRFWFCITIHTNRTIFACISSNLSWSWPKYLKLSIYFICCCRCCAGTEWNCNPIIRSIDTLRSDKIIGNNFTIKKLHWLVVLSIDRCTKWLLLSAPHCAHDQTNQKIRSNISGGFKINVCGAAYRSAK